MTNAIATEFELKRISDELSRGKRVLTLSGLTSISSKSFILSEISRRIESPIVIITDTNKELREWETDLRFWFSRQTESKATSELQTSNSKILSLPAFDVDPYSGVSPHAVTQELRALTLWSMTRSTPTFLVISAKSLITRIPTRDQIAMLGLDIARDEELAPTGLIELLFSAGYKRAEPVSNVGEFSMRGGIVDVWSPDSDLPIRIEFFGDTIDSIRTFDPSLQLSIEKLDASMIAPMREFAASKDDFISWAGAAREKFTGEAFAADLRDRTDFADEGEDFPGWEFQLPLVNPLESSIFGFFEKAVFVADEPILIARSIEDHYVRVESRFEEAEEHGEVAPEPDALFLNSPEVQEVFENLQRLELRNLGKLESKTDEGFATDGKLADIVESRGAKKKKPLFLFSTATNSSDFEIVSRSPRKYHGDIKEFAKAEFQTAVSPPQTEPELRARRFVFQTKGLAERFDDILRDYEIVLPSGAIEIGNLSSGFEIPSLGQIVFTEAEIFGDVTDSRHASNKPKQALPKTSAFISDFRDLKIGDYVVHVDHGIARFDGLQTIESQSVSREFILLIYSDDAKLFVPVERLDLVSRYGSGEAIEPKLDRLGGIGWQKTKAKAKRAMRDMADELLRLYAERKLVSGFAFSRDAPWQAEFEEAFPYELTRNQKSSIADIKKDMETPAPMDRLIIGDVGYGKTEVAMRAAFKAVMDGRQVVVLTPTTVLAYQHFETFKTRFAAFPIRVEMISRFRSQKAQKEIVEKCEKGEIDILIGTHRVLSSDVKLPNIGLVIVDEEQRFGVSHKEKLKKLKKKIDVLTLTATPIPRTLNMSMIGMRDMSLIETPPRDRLAINTQVVQFSEGVIRSAIELELARSGQIFFIHNRVKTIESIAAHIKRIVPNARIAVGHGQMREKELERVMLDFVDYKYDVLIATTIIENGIDIPRANTIIVNRADNYGLSQLYQLRGRVGRSSRRAYAYLLIAGEQELTPIARRRLSAIREFSDLGAGFRLAALDLELRGAGSILSGQQSGHVDSLGFDLYTKMLNRTIQELRGEEIDDETSVALNLGVDVSIPTDYLSETSQRLRTYKRVSSASDEHELRNIYLEISDRYGKMPESVENLFEYARLRQSAEKLHLIAIDRTKEGVAIKFGEKSLALPEALFEFVESREGAKFSPNGILRVPLDDENPISSAREILENLKS